MQHWTWAETLTALQQPDAFEGQALHVVDAHSMAPFSEWSPPPPAAAGVVADPFARVASRLPGAGSAYEQAWYELTGPTAAVYPSTAVLTTQLWKGPLWLTLCENDIETARRIHTWASGGAHTSRHAGQEGMVSRGMRRLPTRSIARVEVHHGDWRQRFDLGITSWGDLTILTFDPNHFHRFDPAVRDNAGMYPLDLRRVLDSVVGIAQPVVIMLTNYSANAGNTPGNVLPVWDASLAHGAFQRVGTVRPHNRNYMAALYARALPRSVAAAITRAVSTECFNAWIARAGWRMTPAALE